MYMMWLPRQLTGYRLHEDAFTDVLQEDIRTQTKLQISSWLGDWWTYSYAERPVLTWEQLLHLALHILHCQATRLFVGNLYLKTLPTYTLTPTTLPLTGFVRGAKRVNAYSERPHRFRLHGKDEGCCVEGTWYDWCCFACNILAHENTKIACPDVYEPLLENNNY